MENDENKTFINASGVILSRKISGENSMWITLFLREKGIIETSSKFSGGDNEPLVWGNFVLRKKIKSKNYFIDDIEIFDDMLSLRKRKDTIMTAMKWTKTITKYLIREQPDDDLLTNLYWSMKLLSEPKVPSDASDWRFIWRWLQEWGLAPDFVSFYTSMKFNADEIHFLSQIAQNDTKGVIDLFSKPLNNKIRENIFKIAAKITVKFLEEV